MNKNISPPFGVNSRPLLLLTFILVCTLGRAQRIQFSFKDGTNASYNLVNVEKLTFTADVMNLHLFEGSVYTWNVSTIENYKYQESSPTVEQIFNAWQVNIYPNPVSSLLNIQFNLPKDDNINVVLYDLQGKIILEKKLGKINSGEFYETLDIINLSTGAYLCKVIGENYSLTKKIIKN